MKIAHAAIALFALYGVLYLILWCTDKAWLH